MTIPNIVPQMIASYLTDSPSDRSLYIKNIIKDVIKNNYLENSSHCIKGLSSCLLNLLITTI